MINSFYSHKERVLRVINKKSIDKLPSEISFSEEAQEKFAPYFNVNKNDFYNQLLDNHIKFAYTLGSHYSWLDKQVAISAEEKGFIRIDKASNTVYDNWNVGWFMGQEGIFMKHHPLASVNNLNDFTFPDPNNTNLFDEAKKIVEKYGKEYFVVAAQDIFIFTRAYALRGFENLLCDLKLNKSFFIELLDRITEYEIRVAKEFVSIGVDGVFTADDYGHQVDCIISPDDWRKFIKPRVKQVWDVYKTANLPVIHHSCGNVAKIIPDFIEMGLDVLNPIQSVMNPYELKRQFGDQISFWGGIDTQHLLPSKSPNEIDKEIKDIISILSSKGGYIIGPTQCIMTDVPLENVKVFLDAVRKYSYF